MARLGLVGVDGKLFHLDSTTTKKKKDEEVKTNVKETDNVAKKDIRTIKTEDTTKKLKEAEDNLDLKTAERQKKESEIYEKAGQTFNTKFEKPETLTYDTKGKKKTALPEQKISTKEVRNQVSKELDEEQEAYDKWKLANYENNLAKANEENYGLWDKSVGNVTRAIKDLVSPLTEGEDSIIVDKKGNKTFLPSYNELRQEAVQKSYGNDLFGKAGKVAGDILYGGSKILGAAALDTASGGIGGKALYWTDMATDNYKKVKNKGYSNEDAIKNTIISTGSEFLTERLLGGVSKTLTGGKASELQNVISKSVGKVIKNPNVANVIGSMGAEGVEEFIQDWIGALNDKVTLGEDIDVDEVVQSSLYSALIGAGTGGLVTGSLSRINPSSIGGNGQISNINQEVNEIQQKAQNGEISYEQANQQLEQVQNGTYQQNRNLESIASQQVQEIQQAVQTGQMSLEEGNTQIQAITNTLESERNRINQPQIIENVQNKADLGENISQNEEKKVKNEVKETESDKTKVIRRTLNNDEGRNYKGIFYPDKNFEKYSDNDIKTIGDLIEKDKNKQEYTPKEKQQLEYLKRKKSGLKNPELNSKINKFEDIRDDYKYYKNYNPDKFDSTMLDKAKGIIEGNRYGRTKQQWLDVANFMGQQMQDADSETIRKYAYESFASELPYKNMNKQGQKRTKLELHEWVKSFYDGARVGNKVENKAETQATQKETQKVKTNDNKQEKVQEPKITVETLKNISKDLSKELNESFKLKKGEAYSRTPQTAVKNMSVYPDAPQITDFDRQTVVHTVMTDEAAKIDAKARYEKNGSLEENASYIRGLLQSDKRLTKNDKALAIYTMKEAYRQGNKSIGDGIVSDLTVLDVEAGQWAQASKLMKQMTPVGQIQTFAKMINNSVEKGNPRFKNVKITDEMVNEVLDCYDKDNNWDQDLFAEKMEKFKDNIQQQMTPTLMDKFNSIRMLGMLGAPRTHIRNILGNVGNLGLRVSKNFNDRLMESIFIRDKDQRTRTFKPTTKEIKNYVDNLTKEEIMTGNKYDDTKTELERNMKVFNEKHKGMSKIVNPISKGLNVLSKGNSFLLDWEDKLFSSIAYKTSLQEYLTAKGMKTVEDLNNNPEILAKGKSFAMQQALEATYRQDSELASAITNYVKKAEKPNAKKTDKFFGTIVEANIPFKKTPINIAKTGIQFSPIGLANGIYDTLVNVRNGKVEMSQAIDEMSKGITGLGLLGVGVLLAHNGFELTAADEDKDKKAKYDKLLGEMEYSIKIGDRYYDLAWMAPTSMPFYTGIELYQTLVKQKEFDGNAVVNTLAKTIDPLSSMSLLEGLSKSVKSYSKTPGEFISKFTLSSLENYVTQYIPTLFSQIANISDDNKRTTTPSGKSSFTEFDKTWNNIMYKLPFARQTLPEQTDAWGRTNKNDDLGLRIFNSLINPASNSKDKKDATDREIERLYNALGEDDYYSSRSIPKVDFDKYLTYNKEKYNLSNKELTQFKKTYGKYAKDGADKLIKTEEYKKATDLEKAKMLSSLYDYANQKAKEEYGKKNNIDFDNYKLDQIYSLADAYNIPIEKVVSNKTIGQLKAGGGTTAKQRKIDAVDNIKGLNKVQKDALKRKFTMFMGRPGYKDGEYALVDVLNDSSVSKKTKDEIKRFLDLS